MKKNWVVPVLAVQILLTFFAPPISWEKRKIFLSDLWCFSWVGTFLAWFLYASFLKKKKNIKSFIKKYQFETYSIVGASLLFGLVYIHGVVRPDLYWIFHHNTIYLKDTTAFAPFREFVVMARFLCWFTAAILVVYWVKNGILEKKQITKLHRILLFSVVVASLAMVMAKLSSDIRVLLGVVYGYDPNYEFWRNREYGIFPSPVEASFTFVLSGLIFWTGKYLKKNELYVGVVAAAIGFFLSKTITPLIALVFVAVLISAWQRKGPIRWVLPVLLVFGAIAFSELASHFPLIESKLQNFTYRFKTMIAYWDVAQMRTDYLLIGLGFTNTYTDNIYLFFWSRGGVILFLTVLWFVLSRMRRNWKRWSIQQKLIPLFFMVTGLTFDAFIFRHVVVLMMTLGVPVLLVTGRRR